MKVTETIRITQYIDGDFEIAEYTETGTYIGSIHVSPDELPALNKALQDEEKRS